MTKPIIQGWCPGALRPMLSGDGLVVRIRPRGGRLTPDQVVGIAALSAKHGNGLIDLSARANLQLRGVTDSRYEPLMTGLKQLGLLDTSAEIEARRNILVTPFWQDGDGTQAIAAKLAQALEADDAPDLPGKFGFSVDVGATPVLTAASADIRIEQVNGEMICRPDGANTGAPVTPETAVAAALRLAHWFVNSGGVTDGRGRMAAHWARGIQQVSSSKTSCPDLVFPPEFLTVRSEHNPATPPPPPGPHALGFLVGLEFGQIAATTLAQLGAVRLTPWRMLLIERLVTAPNLPGLIAGPDDPLLRVVACTGAPECPQGLQPTRRLARALAPHLPKGALLHVSGCAKGCAQPGGAAMTLVAQNDGFGFIPAGTPSDIPSLNGLTETVLQADPSILRGLT